MDGYWRLTPLLLSLPRVIFATLSYIDNHKKKQHPPPKVDAISLLLNIISEGKSELVFDDLSKQIIHQSRLFCKWLYFTYFFCTFHHIQKYIAVSQLIQHLLQATYQNFVRQFLLGMSFLYSQYLNECLHQNLYVCFPNHHRQY